MGRSRYPRPGQRLAPLALRELLQSPVGEKYLRGKSPRSRLCDLDESAWERFGESACRELARDVVRAAGRGLRGTSAVGGHRLPALPAGVTLADLPLEARTRNCLAAAGLLDRPQDLRSLTLNALLGLKGFWVKSLIDLLTAIEHAAAHPQSCRPLPPAPTAGGRRSPHAYPRPGERLAPQTLKEVLLERVPPRFVRGTPLKNARLCDLDERVWEHLSTETIVQLAERVTARATAAQRHGGVRQRRLMSPSPALRLADLRLENRTCNCLIRAGLGEHVGRLGELTVGDLLSMRSFGTKCLVDLLTALESRAACDGVRCAELTAAAEALAGLPAAAEIHFTDPRLGDLLRAMDSESNTVAEMCQRQRQRRFDPSDPARLAAQLDQLRSRVAALLQMPLDEELTQVFSCGVSPRDRQIVAAYYGWDGGGRRTLEDLGREHGLSRERIRQVCARAVQPQRHRTVFAPALDRALAFLAERYPRAIGGLQAEFDAAGYCARPLPIEAVHEAALLLGRTPPFVIVEVGWRRLAVDPRYAKLPKVILRAARKVVANFGAGTIAQVVGQIAARVRSQLTSKLVRETLQTADDFHWLDRRRLWFKMDSLPQYGLPNLVDKVLAVAGTVELRALRAALVRARRGKGRPLPPPGALREFCRLLPGVRIVGNRATGDAPRDGDQFLSPVERVMTAVLRTHGPIMHRGEFEERCLAGGVSRFSFNAILTISPVIQSFGRSLYGLTGAAVTRRQRTAAAHREPNDLPRVLHSFGRPDKSTVFIAYRLSKAAISGGVITVPAALKRALRGKFALRTSQGEPAGTMVTKNGCGWGLGPALRRSHAQIGDYLVLLLDIAARQGQLHIGDERVLAQAQPPPDG